MAEKDVQKGSIISLETFLGYKKPEIGFKTINKNNVEMVNFIHCKLCAKHRNALLRKPDCKGSAKKALLQYIEGTNFVSKWTIDRHLKGKGHGWAMQLEKSLPKESQVKLNDVASGSSMSQPKIQTTLEKSTKTAYTALFNAAYRLAITPSMPMHHFKVITDTLRDNNVQLISGKDDDKCARDYIRHIAMVVREKILETVKIKNFFSILIDGSQARKTGSEKEMVLIRLERNGSPCYFLVDLMDMDQHGGGTANAITDTLNNVFNEERGVIPISEDDYKFKLIAMTSDGASVNFGRNNGVLTQMAEERPWLLKIHCANHRIELALSDATSASTFKEVDEMYMTIFMLHKNSGRVSSAVKTACTALTIAYYKLPKIHGTRFVNHRRRGFKAFLKILPALIVGYQTLLEDQKTTSVTRSKLKGILDHIGSYQFFLKMASYLDLLEAAGPASLVFEEDSFMPNEIIPQIKRTCSELDAVCDEAGTDGELLSSYVSMLKQDDDNGLEGTFDKENDTRKQKQNRQPIVVKLDGMKYSERSREQIARSKAKFGKEIKDLIAERFEFVEEMEEVYTAMSFYDPKNWVENDIIYGVQQLQVLLKYFGEPLSHAGVVQRELFQEWRSFKALALRSLRHHFLTPHTMWKNVLQYRRREFPNLCILVELLTCVSGSNSAVERSFSILTLMLSDRRLRMSHETMTDILVIKGNEKAWSSAEKKEIINCAVEKYMSTPRKRKLDMNDEPAEDVHFDIIEERDNGEDDEDEGEDEEMCLFPLGNFEDLL